VEKKWAQPIGFFPFKLPKIFGRKSQREIWIKKPGAKKGGKRFRFGEIS